MYTEMAEAFFKKVVSLLYARTLNSKFCILILLFLLPHRVFASGKYGGGVFGATAAAAGGGKEDKRVLEMDLLLVMLYRAVGNYT